MINDSFEWESSLRALDFGLVRVVRCCWFQCAEFKLGQPDYKWPTFHSYFRYFNYERVKTHKEAPVQNFASLW